MSLKRTPIDYDNKADDDDVMRILRMMMMTEQMMMIMMIMMTMILIQNLFRDGPESPHHRASTLSDGKYN